MIPFLFISLLFYTFESFASASTFKWPPLTSPSDHERLNFLQDPYMSPAFEYHFDIAPLDASDNRSPTYQVHLSASDATQHTFECSFKDAFSHEHEHEHVDFPNLSPQEKKDYALKILRPLLSQPCLLSQESWWTYEYCHLNRVRQVHPGLILSTENSLGSYFSEADGVVQFLSGQSPVSQAQNTSEKVDGFTIEYRLGDVCEEFNIHRKTTVEFRCNHNEPLDRIVKVQEVSSCTYWMLIESPLLCKDPWFSQSLGKPKLLDCRLKKASHLSNDPPLPLTHDQMANLERLVQSLNQPDRSLRTLILKSKSSLADTLALQRSSSKAGLNADPYAGLLSFLGLSGSDPIERAEEELSQRSSSNDPSLPSTGERANVQVIVLDNEEDQEAVQSLLNEVEQRQEPEPEHPEHEHEHEHEPKLEQTLPLTTDKRVQRKSAADKNEKKTTKKTETPFKLVQEIVKLMIPEDSVELDDDPQSGDHSEQRNTKADKNKREESSKKSTRKLRKQIFKMFEL